MMGTDANTVKIRGGRSMWREAPTCTISDGNYGGDLFEIENAELQLDKSAGNTFQIRSRHQTFKDCDNDSIFIFVAEGAGMLFDNLAGKKVRFTGVLTAVKYYSDEIVEGSSGYRYHPPMQPFKSRLVEIEFDYYDRSGNDVSDTE